MLTWLRETFDAADTESANSLAIQGGRGGARLTHSHARQYRYVEQVLGVRVLARVGLCVCVRERERQRNKRVPPCEIVMCGC